MARKKQPPPPLSRLRFDFVDSLENVCNQSMMLLQAVDSVLSRDILKPAIADILRERSTALREALIGKDDDGLPQD